MLCKLVTAAFTGSSLTFFFLSTLGSKCVSYFEIIICLTLFFLTALQIPNSNISSFWREMLSSFDTYWNWISDSVGSLLDFCPDIASNEFYMKKGHPAVNQKMESYPHKAPMAADIVSKGLFHYSLHMELLQDLCVADIIAAVLLCYLKERCHVLNLVM